MELYKTIRQEAEEMQIIEKSRFIAHAKPVESREEADKFIAEIKSKYKDATHNVPAMVLGEKMQIQWASDDGEPQGTSGAPMVQMLVSEGLTNLVIVVTRYFGGIKLGTGGLVRAYTSSAKLAIEAAGICSVQEVCLMTTVMDYTYLAKVQKMSADSLNCGEMNSNTMGGTGKKKEQGNAKGDESLSFIIKEIDYGEKVSLKLVTQQENEEMLRKLIANISSGTGEVIKTSTVKMAV